MKKSALYLLIVAVVFSACQKSTDVIANNAEYLSKSSKNNAATDGFYESTLGQTPIDILTDLTTKTQAADPIFHYTPFDGDVKYNKTHYNYDPNGEIFTEAHDEFNLKVELHGVTMSQPITFNRNNYITINGTKYYLLQYHFHWDSEHALNGKKFDMEVHLVHQSDAGKLAVVGVFIEKGEENEVLHEIFEASPHETGVINELHHFNASKLLPEHKKEYFTYSGSLTTPGGGVTVVPYLPGLKWFVFKHPIEVAEHDYDEYTELYEEPNARPIQPLLGRKVYAIGSHDENEN